MKLRVWGKINGVAFSEVYDSVADWKAERRSIEAVVRVDVHGMQSVTA